MGCTKYSAASNRGQGRIYSGVHSNVQTPKLKSVYTTSGKFVLVFMVSDSPDHSRTMKDFLSFRIYEISKYFYMLMEFKKSHLNITQPEF